MSKHNRERRLARPDRILEPLHPGEQSRRAKMRAESHAERYPDPPRYITKLGDPSKKGIATPAPILKPITASDSGAVSFAARRLLAIASALGS